MIGTAEPATTPTVAPPVSPPAARSGRTKEELLDTISASRLGTWLGCRLKFYFRYVAGIYKPATPARHIGSVVHQVLQQWSLARWRRAPLAGEMITAVFDQAWASANLGEEIAWNRAEDENEDTAKATALGLIELYLRETPIPTGERPEAVEVMVEKDLSAQGLPKLVGVLDLVGAGGRIVDFKTTGKTPNTELTLHTNDIQLHRVFAAVSRSDGPARNRTGTPSSREDGNTQAHRHRSPARDRRADHALLPLGRELRARRGERGLRAGLCLCRVRILQRVPALVVGHANHRRKIKPVLPPGSAGFSASTNRKNQTIKSKEKHHGEHHTVFPAGLVR